MIRKRTKSNMNENSLEDFGIGNFKAIFASALDFVFINEYN